MSRAQRLQESVLMRERWHLIQSGVSRKSIRVKGDSLYLNHKLHGRVSNSKFEHATSASVTLPSSQLGSPSRGLVTVQDDNQSDIPVQNTSLSDKLTTPPVNNTCLQVTSSGSVDT